MGKTYYVSDSVNQGMSIVKRTYTNLRGQAAPLEVIHDLLVM